jgi:hypothetical protein
MKRNVFSFILFLFLVVGSCSHILRKPYVDPVLKPAFDNWVEECKSRGIKYKRDISHIDSILYAPLEERYWGKCYGGKIIINNLSISPIDEFTLKLVLFHELGHCAFNYDHYEGGVDIMNSILPEDNIPLYHYFWDEFLVDTYFTNYKTKRERRKLKKKLEKQNCFCILDEDKLQVK